MEFRDDGCVIEFRREKTLTEANVNWSNHDVPRGIKIQKFKHELVISHDSYACNQQLQALHQSDNQQSQRQDTTILAALLQCIIHFNYYSGVLTLRTHGTMADDWQEQDAAEEEDDLDDDEDDDILDMGDDVGGPPEDVLLMRFCPHDSSMLYPQENKRERQLQYACRLCRYTEPAPDQPLIYRNEMKKEVGNILHTVPSAVSDDPTLARSQNANCSNCGFNEAVFFQSDIAQSDSLALIFVCCNCDHKWVN